MTLGSIVPACETLPSSCPTWQLKRVGPDRRIPRWTPSHYGTGWDTIRRRRAMTKILFAAAGYIAIVFPLALVWHLGLFKQQYQTFGYFAGKPNVPVGLATVVIQGVVLALIYPLFHSGSAGFVRAFQFAGLMGLFFWTSHVLALVAKQNVPNAVGFIVIETGYLIAQFSLFALLLGFIYRGVE